MRFFPVALVLVAAPAAAGPVPADPVERCRGLVAIDAAAPYAAAQFGRVEAVEPVLFGTSMTAMTETIRDPTAALQAAKPRLAMGVVMLSSLGLPEPAMSALSAFVADLPTPRGPLTITLSPTTPVPLLFLVSPPDDTTLRTAIERLNLKVAY